MASNVFTACLTAYQWPKNQDANLTTLPPIPVQCSHSHATFIESGTTNFVNGTTLPIVTH